MPANDPLSEGSAVEIITGRHDAGMALLCDHASCTLPPGYSWSPEDAWIAETHWAWDPGAAILTRELAAAFEAPAVLAGFSRLLVDPNRPPHAATLFRTHAEGRPVALNSALSQGERCQRLERFHAPYHTAASDLARSSEGPLLLSIHTFSPVFEGEVRTLEVGVLWDSADEENEYVAQQLEAAGFVTGRNAPYSGKAGLAYSVERHAKTHGLVAVELELRQDLVMDATFRRRVIAVVDDVRAGLLAAR